MLQSPTVFFKIISTLLTNLLNFFFLYIFRCTLEYDLSWS